jgi:hypothetical protein
MRQVLPKPPSFSQLFVMAKYPNLPVIFGSAVFLLGVAAWIKTGRMESQSGRVDPPPPRSEAQRSPLAPGDLRPDSGVTERLERTVEPTVGVTTQVEIQAAILEEIHEAAISYEASELPLIEKYLLHGDGVVREAAREGMITLGSPEAVPLLRKAAALAGDPREAVALLDAADYLELPSADLQRLLRRKKAGR